MNKIIAAKTSEAESLRSKIKASESADEVRSLGETLQSVLDELNEAKAKLDELDKQDDEGDNGAGDGAGDEGANKDEGGENRSFNPMKAIGGVQMRGNNVGVENNEISTMEERTAFMNYYLRGEKSEHLRYETRTGDEAGTSANLGVLIPQTIIQEIIKETEKVRGVLYSKVRKLNVKGGVKFPIGSFSATFHRIGETSKSDRQNAGGITDSIIFSYKIGEIRLARTLLQSVLSVPVFEQEFAKVIVEAYVAAMDDEILNGDGDDEMNGIITEATKVSGSRIPSSHIITFTEAEIADWTSWQKKLFAKIPLGMRKYRPEFVMSAGTYEANIKTLKDNNNRPLYAETYNPIDGDETSTFKGKEVAFVENDVFGDFDDIDLSDDDVNPFFGMYWVPNKAYAINSNLEFAVRDYYDEEANQFVKKATVINDGNVLDGNCIFLLKKVASTSAQG
ncbi:MAG: phage major capsid protein [Bacteroidales bacterium]|nr:phage major capsid protein [Bacteroidales bacterium]